MWSFCISRNTYQFEIFKICTSEFDSIPEGVGNYLALSLHAHNEYFINAQGITKEYIIFSIGDMKRTVQFAI